MLRIFQNIVDAFRIPVPALRGRVGGETVALFLSLFFFVSCNKEPDESDLYTFTGQTIQEFVEEDDNLSLFRQILERANLWAELRTYGQYTCYAPSNEGVVAYVDSLWNDPKSTDDNGNLVHNGMSENSVNGLTEQQCKEIAKYHISTMTYLYADLSETSSAGANEVFTYLGQTFSSEICDDGSVRLGGSAIVDRDNDRHDIELANGFLHYINKVIPRNTQTINEMMKNLTQYKVFYEALDKTGMLQLLSKTKKEFNNAIDNNHGRPGSSWSSTEFYVPTECNVRYTVFAEDSAIMAANGIRTFADLKAKCVEWYKDAENWYPLPDGEKISTGDDYTYTYNVVNMFVRYHILKAGMATSKLLYGYSSSNANWNYAFGGEPFDYYETLLPHTLMKIWQPLYQRENGEISTGSKTGIFINRFRQHNTLTDEVGTMGKASTHQVLIPGIMVYTDSRSNIKALNGYVHGINGMLLYSADVPQKVLNERLRIDTGSMLYELANNDIRFATETEIASKNLNGSAGTMTRFPVDYFDNLYSFTGTSSGISWYTQGAWRAWEADQLSFWGAYDFAVKLPSVPTGDYELRVIYPPMANSGLMQYFIGTSKNAASMQPLGVPFDARYPNSSLDADRDATGYMLSSEFSDYGVASDLVMRNHSYMRAPSSFSRGTYNGIKERATSADQLIQTISNCCRYEEGYGTSMMRRILGTIHLDQRNDYWLRLRNLIPEETTLGGSFDFLELVPTTVINDATMTEDWY